MSSPWILIFYLAAHGPYVNNGGPATAQFGTKQACEDAAGAIQKMWPDRYKGHVCVAR